LICFVNVRIVFVQILVPALVKTVRTMIAFVIATENMSKENNYG
tara:strand:+ start:817 stop:948 length:132 start_codon:yes stop_codon:yes gene_type:complete